MPDSPSMLEVILIPAEPADTIRAQAVHEADDPEAPWYVMIAPCDRDFWLLWVEAESLEAFRTVSFDEKATTILLRLAVLLGDKWSDLWDDFSELIETQMQVLEAVQQQFITNALTKDLDELADWRQTMENAPPSAGELMRHELLGVQPLQGRN